MTPNEPLDDVEKVLGHDLQKERVSPRLPDGNLMVIMQTDDTVTFREAGETDAWLTSDYMVEL